MIRSFRGITPVIAETAFISEAAYVIGDVEIGEHSSVWPGAVIRGDFGKIRIGKNTAIEDNSVIHSGSPGVEFADLVIGDYVHIGHGVVINGRKIGNHVLVGMNATILHEVEIGEFCILGASCMVPQEMKIPERSFVVGVPAEIKGEITEKQMWWVKQAPSSYSKMAEEYIKDGNL